MIVCEKCGTQYSEDQEKCPNCGEANPIYEPVETDEEAVEEVDAVEDKIETHPNEPEPLNGRVDLDDELEQKSLVRIFRAPNESIANIVKGLLESEGVPVYVDSRMVPWLNGVMKAGEGFYGDIVVPESEVERSREIIKAYQGNELAEHGEEEQTS